MTPAEYNAREIKSGTLTVAHLYKLLGPEALEEAVRAYQTAHGLVADGMAGSQTRASLEAAVASYCWPLRCQPDGTRPHQSGNLFKPGKHEGIDIFVGPKTPKGWPDTAGAPVVAAARGVVLWAYNHPNGWRAKLDHHDGWTTMYLHLDPRRPGVHKGEFVEMGHQLGFIGGPAIQSLPHLHFETRRLGHPQPPLEWLAGAVYLPAG